MTLKGGILLNDEAISPVLGAVLILAIGMTILTTVQVSFMPVWNAEEELNHLEKMNDDFKELKSGIESSAVSGTALSSPLSMGFKYSQKIIGYNPRERAYATFNIQKDTWAEVRYNEMLTEGMDDATSIKNITSSTITYSLLTPQNLSPFIYEHGLIRRGGSNYTAGAQSLIANGTLYLLSVNATEPESTTSAERRAINIYPTSPAKNSIIGKNVWLILHTEYVDWWADDPNNPSSIQNLGGTIKKKDSVNGNIIAFFEGMEIRMGETQVTARSKKPPSRLPQYRLVKVSPQNVNLPVEGITNLALEVQDYYNNPVPNVLVNFSINTTRRPANAYSTASLLQSSAISGADGRANIMLRTSGPGIYYIDASISSSNTSFVYPASSQGGFISLAYTGAEPTYTITATLRNASGELASFEQVSFATSNGTVTPTTGVTDAFGNASTTLNTSTATDIRITNIQTLDVTVTNSSAIITWDTLNTITVAANRTPGGYVFNSVDIPTNVNSSGCVRYGTTPGSYPYITCDSQLSSHNVTLSSLLPENVYYFIVNSSRPSGASINSSEYMFVTTPEIIPTPPASVTNLTNVTYVPLYINWTWTDPLDVDFDHVEIYIDGTSKGIVTKDVQYYNASYFRPNSSHIISTRTVDTSGYVNTTWENRTANTTSVFTYVFDFLNITGTVTDPNSAKNDSDSGASTILTEGINNNITVKYNWSFTSPIVNNESWIFTYSITTGAPTLTGGNTTADGVPPGSLFANLSSTANSLETAITSWRSPNFTWNNGTPSSSVLNFSYRVVLLTGAGATVSYDVFLIDPNGIKKQINQTNSSNTAGGWGNFSNNSIVITDFSASGNYSLLLNATLTTKRVSGITPGIVAVRWDNPNLTLNYNTYGLNVTANTTGIPDATTQVLQLRYNVSAPGDNFTVQLWNGTNSTWNSKTTLNSSSLAYFNVTLESGELLSDGAFTGGSVGDLNKYYVRVRYTDVDASASQQGRLYLDYQRVYST